MMLKKFFNWLLAPVRDVHYLWLNKRAHIVGAQFAYATLVSHGRIVQACDAVKNKTPLLA